PGGVPAGGRGAGADLFGNLGRPWSGCGTRRDLVQPVKKVERGRKKLVNGEGSIWILRPWDPTSRKAWELRASGQLPDRGHGRHQLAGSPARVWVLAPEPAPGSPPLRSYPARLRRRLGVAGGSAGRNRGRRRCRAPAQPASDVPLDGLYVAG